MLEVGPLFGDIDWGGIGINGIFTAVGAAAVYLLTWLDKRGDKKRKQALEDHATSRAEKVEDEKVTIQQMRDYAERTEANEQRCQERLAKQDEKIQELIDDVVRLRLNNTNIWGWVKYSIFLLKSNKIEHELPPRIDVE